LYTGNSRLRAVSEHNSVERNYGETAPPLQCYWRSWRVFAVFARGCLLNLQLRCLDDFFETRHFAVDQALEVVRPLLFGGRYGGSKRCHLRLYPGVVEGFGNRLGKHLDAVGRCADRRNDSIPDVQIELRYTGLGECRRIG